MKRSFNYAELEKVLREGDLGRESNDLEIVWKRTWQSG
jgi:hypothetical protein